MYNVINESIHVLEKLSNFVVCFIHGHACNTALPIPRGSSLNYADIDFLQTKRFGSGFGRLVLLKSMSWSICLKFHDRAPFKVI